MVMFLHNNEIGSGQKAKERVEKINWKKIFITEKNIVELKKITDKEFGQWKNEGRKN